MSLYKLSDSLVLYKNEEEWSGFMKNEEKNGKQHRVYESDLQ